MLIHARSARVALAGLVAFAAGSLSGTAAAAPPANDAFSAAELVSGRTAVVTGSNVEATKEAGEPNHAGESGGASIWYEWTAPAAGHATFSTCSSPVDTLLGVYTGTAVDNLAEVAADADGCGDQSRASFPASAGTTYRIAVDGVDGETGAIELQFNLAPPNDDFADAAGLTGETGSTSGTNVGASTEDAEPEHYFGIGYPSVWFSWTAPSSGWATFETCGSGFDTVLAAYVGSTLGELTEVASNDDAVCWPGSRITFEAAAGTVYLIAVAGFDGEVGEFTLTWNRNAPPPEPPYAVRSPAITGNPVEGQTLTASEGQWLGTQPISLGFEWGRCDREFERCGFIAGANGRTYVPAAGDVGWRLYVRVTATNGVGSRAEFSNLTAAVAARPPQNMVVPFVSGRARSGQILVATTGEWAGTGPMSFSYQWQSCDAAEDCFDLRGEAAPVLRVSAAHLSRTLRVVVTATNPGGSASASSDTTAFVRRTAAARRCVVPNVKRKTAAAARRAIRRAGCTTGRVVRALSSSVRSGRVISQSPRPGVWRAAGARVNLVLSKGRKR
jgi:PASTA domain